MVYKVSQVGSGHDSKSCEEDGEDGHQGAGAAPLRPWVPFVAVVRLTPKEERNIGIANVKKDSHQVWS